ncbi:transposase [Streptomyces sp. YIM 98790]|uniref:transposase n=1 Tax=Streptomyces sp. YIM 98790 TaxID=2689077 RepID=UPI0037DDBD1C
MPWPRPGSPTNAPAPTGRRLHLACDGRGRPLAVVITPAGNVNDFTVFDDVMDALRVLRTGAGRPRRRPDAVIADKAYSPGRSASPCGAGASGR